MTSMHKKVPYVRTDVVVLLLLVGVPLAAVEAVDDQYQVQDDRFGGFSSG